MSKVICPKCGERDEVVKSFEVICKYDEATDEYLPTEDSRLVVECIDCKTEIEEF